MEYLIFSFIPFSSLLLLFLKDNELKRKKLLNIGLILNTLIFLSPMIYLLLTTPFGENMFSEQSGNGAVLFAYMFLFPICFIVQLVLLTLKIVFAVKSKKQVS
jgi:hypothetical protein